jgi:hypothetical protein
MSTPQLERLQAHCQRLRLYQVAAELPSLLEQAAKAERSYTDFLEEVLRREVQAKTDKHLAMRLAMARFPFQKTLESFDFKVQPSIDVKLIRELGTGRYLEQGENALFLGPPGVGKTHCDTRASMARERQPCQAASHRNEMTPKLIGVFRTRRCLCFGYVSHPKGCRPDARRLA